MSTTLIGSDYPVWFYPQGSSEATQRSAYRTSLSYPTCSKRQFIGSSQQGLSKFLKAEGASSVHDKRIFKKITKWIIAKSSQSSPLSAEEMATIRTFIVGRTYLNKVKTSMGEDSLLKILFYKYNHFQYDELLELLVKNGSDINEVDMGLFKGNTILIWTIANAYYQNAIKLINLGMDLGLNVDLKDSKEQNNALILCLKKGERQDYEGWRMLVKLLIYYTKNLNDCDREGNTPLHVAAFRRDEELVRLLIGFGVHPKLRNKLGQTPKEVWEISVKDLEDENLANICGYIPGADDVTFNNVEREQKKQRAPDELE